MPEILASINRYTRQSTSVVDRAIAAIACAVDEEMPAGGANAGDVDWLGAARSGLDERLPEPVELGFDCTVLIGTRVAYRSAR